MKRKMIDLKPGDLVSVRDVSTVGWSAGTVIDGPFYQEPDDPERLGWWSYKVMSMGRVDHYDERRVEPLEWNSRID